MKRLPPQVTERMTTPMGEAAMLRLRNEGSRHSAEAGTVRVRTADHTG